MQKRAEQLLRIWCDTLLSYQIQTNTPYTNNALLCPACHVIHGRIADLCFPLTVLWAKTGDDSYLAQADRLIDWSEYNLNNERRLWRNDANNPWFGTSAFAAMSMGEAVFYFGDRLPSCYKEKWTAIFTRMTDVFAQMGDEFHPVTNYRCGISALLALAWRLTGNVFYYERAKYWISRVLNRFDSEGLLYGEGDPTAAPDGSHTIDMGYNLEESLPLLLRYATLTGEHMDFFRARLHDHLAFLLPDGGIDNSFGVRQNKWTYWGSRTSDGLIEGLALVLDDPVFADACDRVLRLYERCTHNGLLAMPMAHECGEPTCLHHTFAHAKALAMLVCAKDVPPVIKTPLPCLDSIRLYQNGRLVLVSRGKFRATFSAVNAMFLPDYASNGGGSMNLLYHQDYGVICAATSAQYQPSEPLNQQYLRHADQTACMTAQFVVNGKMSSMDPDVALVVDGTTVCAKAAAWQAQYTIGDEVDIALTCRDGIYNLPIVCKKNSVVVPAADGCSVTIDNQLTVTSDVPLIVDCEKRMFNQTSGLLYLPISVPVQGSARLTIKA